MKNYLILAFFFSGAIVFAFFVFPEKEFICISKSPEKNRCIKHVTTKDGRQFYTLKFTGGLHKTEIDIFSIAVNQSFVNLQWKENNVLVITYPKGVKLGKLKREALSFSEKVRIKYKSYDICPRLSFVPMKEGKENVVEVRLHKHLAAFANTFEAHGAGEIKAFASSVREEGETSALLLGGAYDFYLFRHRDTVCSVKNVQVEAGKQYEIMAGSW